MDTSSLQTRLWQEVSILTFALLLLWGILLWPLMSEKPVFLASVLAGTSGILLAMSFSLSSFSYYFNFLDSKVAYRKQLGLMGYFLALGYAVFTATQRPELYLYSFPGNILTIEVGLGAVAMAIFTLMAIVSNNRAAHLLGGRTWKGILGLGYIAYALLVIRAIFLDAARWQEWLITGEPLFTVRMGLTLLGIAVLVFRASVPFHKQFTQGDKKNIGSPATPFFSSLKDENNKSNVSPLSQ